MSGITWRDSKWKLFLKSLPSEFLESHGREGRKVIRTGGMESIIRRKPFESTKQGTYAFTLTVQQVQGLHCSEQGPVDIYCND